MRPHRTTIEHTPPPRDTVSADISRVWSIVCLSRPALARVLRGLRRLQPGRLFCSLPPGQGRQRTAKCGVALLLIRNARAGDDRQGMGRTRNVCYYQKGSMTAIDGKLQSRMAPARVEVRVSGVQSRRRRQPARQDDDLDATIC